MTSPVSLYVKTPECDFDEVLFKIADIEHDCEVLISRDEVDRLFDNLKNFTRTTRNIQKYILIGDFGKLPVEPDTIVSSQKFLKMTTSNIKYNYININFIGTFEVETLNFTGAVYALWILARKKLTQTISTEKLVIDNYGSKENFFCKNVHWEGYNYFHLPKHHKSRIQTADTSYEILVCEFLQKSHKKYIICDGRHRLLNLIEKGHHEVKVKIFTQDELNKLKLVT